MKYSFQKTEILLLYDGNIPPLRMKYSSHKTEILLWYKGNNPLTIWKFSYEKRKYSFDRMEIFLLRKTYKIFSNIMEIFLTLNSLTRFLSSPVSFNLSITAASWTTKTTKWMFYKNYQEYSGECLSCSWGSTLLKM